MGKENQFIIVLAGSRREFEHFRRANALTEGRDCVYGSHWTKLVGIEATRVQAVGSFWGLVHAGDLAEYAKTRVRARKI